MDRKSRATRTGDSEYLAAAEIYFTAQARAASVGSQRRYFMFAIKAYQAGNMGA